MLPLLDTSTGSTCLRLTNRITGEVQKYTMVNDGDFSVLINRLLTRLYGHNAAAERRGGRYSNDDGRRRWDGSVIGRTMSICEVSATA